MSNPLKAAYNEPNNLERDASSVSEGRPAEVRAVQKSDYGLRGCKRGYRLAGDICPLGTGCGGAAERRFGEVVSILRRIVTNGAIVIHTQRLKSDLGGNLLS